MQKISNFSPPVLAGVVKEAGRKSAMAAIRGCLYSGADIIDLHLSCLDDTSPDTLREIIGSANMPVLALNYNVRRDGTPADYTEDEREELFIRAVKAGAAGIDMQGYTFCPDARDAFVGEDKYSFTKGAPKEVVTDSAVIRKQCAFIEKIHSLGGEVLLSCHPNIYMNAESTVELALFLEERRPDIIKIVTVAQNDEHLTEAFRTMQMLKKEVKTPVAYHASGKAGALSRIVNPMLGGHIVFCVNGYNEASILEQPDLKTAKSIINNIKPMMR